MAAKHDFPGEKHSLDHLPVDERDESYEITNGLHRRLSNRQIQWIAIGGSIGTALFVSIAYGLVEGAMFCSYLDFAILTIGRRPRKPFHLLCALLRHPCSSE